jgi:hypothetical protein
VDVYDRNNAAFIPEGGSNTNTCDALIKVDGTLGLISMVRNNLKLGLS